MTPASRHCAHVGCPIVLVQVVGTRLPTHCMAHDIVDDIGAPSDVAKVDEKGDEK